MTELRGILPVLATPYDAGGEIVESEVRALVRWLIDNTVCAPEIMASSTFCVGTARQ